MHPTINRCLECGAPLVLRAHVQRTRVGRYKVEDSSLHVPRCVHGHTELSLVELASYEQRAAVIVLSEVVDVGGAEIRFARKSLGLTQARLAALLDVAPETISRWETGSESMSRVSRLALLAVVRSAGALARLEKNNLAHIAEVLRVA